MVECGGRGGGERLSFEGELLLVGLEGVTNGFFMVAGHVFALHMVK